MLKKLNENVSLTNLLQLPLQHGGVCRRIMVTGFCIRVIVTFPNCQENAQCNMMSTKENIVFLFFIVRWLKPDDETVFVLV